ncbi:hypothetical protein HGA91_00460 [candidate division WWE3 bacterium]|nr:hypothetical protein [candidate division WWE3 bacterium]
MNTESTVQLLLASDDVALNSTFDVVKIDRSSILMGENTAVIHTNQIPGELFLSTKSSKRPLYLVLDNGSRRTIYVLVLADDQSLLYIAGGAVAVNNGKTLFEQCVDIQQSKRIPLSNHDAYFTKYHQDTEIEYKLNIHTEQSIWQLAQMIYIHGNKGTYPDFILQHHDQFNQWDFDNYLYEVTAPQSERGYISFITCPNDEYVVKQKIYQNDALERIEKRTKNVRIKTSMEDYLHEHYPNLSFSRREPFRRRRYDVNLESLNTGNIYSVMFDHSYLLNDRAYTLTQCEIEYLKSRTVLPLQTVTEELEKVYAVTKDLLRSAGISIEETYYSKLSFLNDYCK